MIYILEIKREENGLWYNSENSVTHPDKELAINYLLQNYGYQLVSLTAIDEEWFVLACKDDVVLE